MPGKAGCCLSGQFQLADQRQVVAGIDAVAFDHAVDLRRLGAAVVLFNIALVALFAALVPPSGDSGDAPVQEAADEN